MIPLMDRDDFCRLEFHCHTSYSKDSLTSPQVLIAAARRKGLDRVVVTDHNTIAGAREARALAPDLIIVGEEIMTTKGELLAAFVTEEVPAGLSPQEAIRRLREQGAFISVSHPFDRLRSGHWAMEDLLEILPLVDAIETFNARCMWPGSNARAEAFAREHGVQATVGSDAHAPFEVGHATMVLPPFEGAEELRDAVRQMRPRLRRSPLWVHLTSRYAVIRKRLQKP
ncbi:MAG: PHP domain-containing protein [Anaerolineae bacterium]|nr:MAG: PHP domain-containing protein [Anaerolineae bacterium]